MIPALSEASVALCCAALLVSPLAAAGLALLNTGLGRSRSASHAMLSSLCAMATAALVYLAVGFSIQGFPGLPSWTTSPGGSTWGWFAAQPLFLRGLDPTANPTAALGALLQFIAVATASLIPQGAGGDRWRLGPSCAATAIYAALTFPLFGHWATSGWLAQLGSNYGLGRGFLDTGGAAAIHVSGGLTALSLAWILGPRRGKYGHDGMPAAMPGHDGVLVLLGCLLAALGWSGLNVSGALLYQGANPGRLIWVALDTLLAASSAALTAAALTRARFGRPDASLCANGWFAGLVASSACAAFVAPLAAALIGAVAGALVIYTVEWLDLKLGVDDPGGAISVHAVAGLWGLLALGIFGRDGQWLAQIVGAATLLGFVFPLTYGLNWTLDRLLPYRVPPEGERQGLDLYELGAGAYPEFVTHYDEFSQR